MNDNRLDVEDAEVDEQALTENDERALPADDAEPVRGPVDDVADEQFAEPSADAFDESLAGEEAATVTPSPGTTSSGTTSSGTASSGTASSGTSSPGTEPLVASESAEAFLERWSEVQTGFIEDPHKAVSEADALLTEVITAYQQAVEQRRARISGAQADGGADTEELRLALLEYRGLLTELLPVGGSAAK